MKAAFFFGNIAIAGLMLALPYRPPAPSYPIVTAPSPASETAAPLQPPVSTTLATPAAGSDAVPADGVSLPTSGRSETGAGDTYPKSSATSPLVVLQFCMNNCLPCVNQQKDVDLLKGQGFEVRYLNINQSQAAHADAERRGVKGYPTYIVVDGSGKEQKRFNHVRDLESFLKAKPQGVSIPSPSSKPAQSRAAMSSPTLAMMGITPSDEHHNFGDVFACSCGGKGNICIPVSEGGLCGGCNNCNGYRALVYGFHAMPRKDGLIGFEVVRPVRTGDYQNVNSYANGISFEYKGEQYAVIESPRMVLKAGQRPCRDCRGWGKACSPDTCGDCPSCGGSGVQNAIGYAPDGFMGEVFSALNEKPLIQFECDLGKVSKSDVPGLRRIDPNAKGTPQTYCTVCTCPGECHCDFCVCKDAAAKQVAINTPLSEPPPGLVSKFLADCLEVNNDLRAAKGGAPRQPLDQRLCKAAQDHADYLARTGKLEHSGANGSPLSRASRYGFHGAVGENAAGDFSTVTNAFNGWLNSTVGHKETLLSRDYDVCGFGYAKGPTGGRWVALYGREGNQSPAQNVQQSPQQAPTQASTYKTAAGHWERRGVFGRQSVWVSDTPQQSGYTSFGGSCSGTGCARR